MEFGQILEIIVLPAITLELFALYNHTKLDHRIDEHIMEANERLAKNESLMNTLDGHMSRIDEHMSKLEEHMTKTDERMTKLDEHTHALLDEYLHQKQKNAPS